MSPPYLSPILSSDSSSSASPPPTQLLASRQQANNIFAAEEFASEQQATQKSQLSDNLRHIETDIQVNELKSSKSAVVGDDTSDEEDEDEFNSGSRADRLHSQRGGQRCLKSCLPVASPTSSARSSLSALYQASGSSAGKQPRKIKQIIQSISPVIATIITIVLMLCLLLSECKSSRVSQVESTEPLVMESSVGLGGNGQRPSQLQQPDSEQYRRPPIVTPAEQFTGEPGAQQLAALRRELIQEQLVRHNRQQRPAKRQSAPMDRPESPLAEEQGGAGFESLGSMLHSSVGGEELTSGQLVEQSPSISGPNQDIPNAYLDGEPQQVASHESRPAHLRSSTLELGEDLAEQQRERPTQSKHRQRHPMQSAQHRYRHQPTQQKQPKQQQQRQQPEQTHATQYLRTNSEEPPSRHLNINNNHDRPFDVAQIQCNNTEEGFERFACPTPDDYGRFRCIEDRLFCDGYYDCPGGEDEERSSCMYYRLKESRHNAHGTID